MAKAARLAGIRIYPIKSLDPLAVAAIRVVGGAGLAGDREFALVDARGDFANAKRLGAPLLRIRARYGPQAGSVRFSADGGREAAFQLPGGAQAIAAWFTERLGRPVVLRRNPRRGFPDDEAASGPTIVGRATLETVAEWFCLEAEEVRRRFRANLELDGLAPFEEDRLFGAAGRPARFRIGAVELQGVNPCARCSVPSRDSLSGAIGDPQFAKRFAELRRRHLPAGIERAAFDHYYRLAVNTRIADDQDGKLLSAGDALALRI